MRFQRLTDEFKIRFAQNGSFELRPGESIKDAVRRHDVPDGYGAYFITSIHGAKKEVVYIGRSGTLQQDGTFKKQALRRRLTMKQEGEYRETFFVRKMEEMKLDCLRFNWFVTHTKNTMVLPALAEAELIQAFWEDQGVLPLWNKTV